MEDVTQEDERESYKIDTEVVEEEDIKVFGNLS